MSERKRVCGNRRFLFLVIHHVQGFGFGIIAFILCVQGLRFGVISFRRFFRLGGNGGGRRLR